MRILNHLNILMFLLLYTGCGFTTLKYQERGSKNYSNKSINGIWFREGTIYCVDCSNSGETYYHEIRFYSDGSFWYLNGSNDYYSEYEYDYNDESMEFISISRSNYKYTISNDILVVKYIPPNVFMNDPIGITGQWKKLTK